ncbi:hypothetical protein NW762_009232 [Fusarium torreyae]|uniref:Beta-lactamase-related domain-containing protein n=1 Tax=Fusarium torreyae TaxID=1237075 RepID=A0A9W8RXD4_9HYPO|nr:hypothetical protein NW762_009232 [Fusarium torreyae]
MDLFNSLNFDRHVKDLMRQNRVPGLSIAIVYGERVQSAGYGFASTADQVPCTADTLFDVASSSKSLTAAAVALLVDDDNFPEVQYDSIMSELLPDDFVLSDDSYTKCVTLDDLLGHRTGMPGHDDSYIGVRAAQPDNARSITRNLRNLAHAVPPRSRYIYCNMMYTVLTHLIEVKAGQTFGNFLQQHIFDPLGMDSSSLQPDGARAKGYGDRLAKGHIWDKKASSYRQIEAENSPEGQGAGSIIASANDFIKFIKALINHEGPINHSVYQGLVQSRSERYPNHRQKKANISRLFYTAGMEYYLLQGHAVFGHSGDITGFGSRFIFLPNFKFGAIVMGNSSGTNSVAAQLFREFADEVVGTQKLTRQIPETKSDKNKDQKHTQLRIQPIGGMQRQPSDKARKDKDNANSKRSKDGMEVDGRHQDAHEAAQQQGEHLNAYTGDYWSPGYHTLRVEIKNNRLFIDATDRSLGFTAILKHQRDQTMYNALVRDYYETGDEVLTTKFVFENGKVVKMGVDLEPLVNDLIWFDKVESST